MPKRPPWNFNMSKEQLELREQKYFTVSNYNFYYYNYFIIIIIIIFINYNLYLLKNKFNIN